MAIFVRRAVQRAFAHLKRQVLTSEQADYLVRRLNSGIDEALYTEWEVIVIAAFAKQGSVVYERPFAIGASKLDLFFESRCKPGIEFLADVTTVSDRFAHSGNAIDKLFAEIRNKHSDVAGKIDVRIESVEDGRYPRQRVKLKLPSKNNISQFVETELAGFFQAISQHPEEPRRFQYGERYLDDDVSLSLQYDPRRRGMSGGYAALCNPVFLLCLGVRVAIAMRQPNLLRQATRKRITGHEGFSESTQAHFFRNAPNSVARDHSPEQITKLCKILRAGISPEHRVPVGAELILMIYAYQIYRSHQTVLTRIVLNYSAFTKRNNSERRVVNTPARAQ